MIARAVRNADEAFRQTRNAEKAFRQTGAVLVAYLVLTLFATWPLVTGLGRDVAWDLGDPLLNIWILAWDAEQILGILQGDFARLGSFFDANIFHPAPLTLAYSEHLVPQALQILPVYAVTGNPILCYNLIFISTFALSGLGMYLFVRELTGNTTAAFVAGLVFAFAPYRIAQGSHIQVLSSQWMPFALYGLRRYLTTRRVRALAGATLAAVTQALSCGYYLLYFTPFVAAYAMWEIWQRRLWRDRRLWLQLSAAAVAAGAIVAPFLLPYAAVRTAALATRSLPEIARYSADVYSYATAPEPQALWGDTLQTFPKAEGELFPGFVPLMLALVGTLMYTRAPFTSTRRRWLSRLLAAAAVLHFAAAIITTVERRVVIDLWVVTLQMSDVTQLLLRAAIAIALLLIVSPAARSSSGAFMRGPGFFAAMLVMAVWLSLGPSPQAFGRPVELLSPYRLLLDHVPGFEGVRVPARFAMVAILMLAVLAGLGVNALTRSRFPAIAVAVVALLVVLEGTARPFLINAASPPAGFVMPEARVYRPARAPAVYREFASRAPGGVLVELPLGEGEFDLRAVYYSTAHWRPVLNGYSGFFPPHYGSLRLSLSELPRHPELSLAALRGAGATHAIVHEGAFRGDEGPATSNALRVLGAVELYRGGTDVLLALPR